MKYVFLTSLILTSSLLFGQNLVPNSSFEAISDCPSFLDDFPFIDWVSPNANTPDCYNVCGGSQVAVPDNLFGFQQSSIGNGYAGVISYLEDDFGGVEYKEYIQVPLISSPMAGECYEISITYSPADLASYSDGLGVYVSEGIPSEYTGLTPQLQKTTVFESRTIWHTISTIYIATGNETHLTVGNFNFDDQTSFLEDPNVIFKGYSYFFIDQVSFEFLGSSNQNLNVDLGEDLVVCESDFPITINSNISDATNNWNTGEVGTSIEIFDPGEYIVESTLGCQSGSDTILISETISPEINIDDQTICSGSTVNITLDNSLGQYLWSNGSTTNSITIDEGGEYFVELISDCGVVFEEFTITELETINLDNIDNYFICESEIPFVIDLTEFADYGNEFLWQDGTTSPVYLVTDPGTYSLNVSNECFTDSISFQVFVVEELPENFEFTDTLLCDSETKLINLPFENVTYQWQDGSDESFYVVQNSGLYSVVVSNLCESKTYEFNIIEQGLIEDLNISDTLICSGESKLITLEIQGFDILWEDGSTDSTFLVEEPGIYSVQLSNSCFGETYEIEISEIEDLTLNLGQDIELCPGDSVFISSSENYQIEWNTGENSSGIWFSEEGEIIGTIQGVCDVISDTVYVNFNGDIPQLVLVDSLSLCESDTIEVMASPNLNDGSIFQWNTGEETNSINISQGGSYVVTSSNSCGVAIDSIFVTVGESLPDPNLDEMYEICEGDSLILSVSGEIIEWSTGSQNESLQVFDEGLYFVKVENSCKVKMDTFEVVFREEINGFNLGDDIGLCVGDSINLIGPNIDGIYSWNTSEETNEIFVFEPGIYTLMIEGDCNSIVDSLEVFDLGNIPTFDLGPNLTFCAGDSLTLSASIDENTSIIWSNGSQETEITIYDEGNYLAIATNECGSSIDSISISLNGELPDFEVDQNIDLCFGDSLVLDVGANTANVSWSTGSTDTVEVFNNEGDYFVVLSNSCDIDSLFFEIESIPVVESLNLPNDTLLCDVESILLDLQIDNDEVDVEWNNGEVTSAILGEEDGIYSVEVSNECFSILDSVVLQFDITPQLIDLGMNDTICTDEEIFLDGFIGDDITYEWQDGSSSPTYTVSSTGTYFLNASTACGLQSDSIEILVLDKLEIENPLDDYYLVCEDDSLTIDLSKLFADEIIWNDGSFDSIRELSLPGAYSIQLINACFETTIAFQFEKENCNELKVYFPNAFSPNFDGNNDEFLVFLPEEWDVQFFEMKLYNRWGENVFKSNDPREGWDGSFKGNPLNSGVYVYSVNIIFEDQNQMPQDLVFKGDVTIVK